MTKKIKVLFFISFLCIAVLSIICFVLSKPPSKQELLIYIEQVEFNYNPKFIRAINKFLLSGNKDITVSLVNKFLDTRSVTLWPDELKDSGAPIKYRPYLEQKKLQAEITNSDIIISHPEPSSEIKWGKGVTVSKLFDTINLTKNCESANIIICEEVLKELKRIRCEEIIDSDRINSLLELLRGKTYFLRTIENLEFICELLYVYSCYEYWPSIRQQSYALGIGMVSSSQRDIFMIVDDAGIESAIKYIDPEMLLRFKESGNIHKKADSPEGVILSNETNNEH